MKLTLIQFNKKQTALSTQYLIKVIGYLSGLSEVVNQTEEDIFGMLSVVLAVMRKCHEAAPDLPNLPPEAAEKP